MSQRCTPRGPGCYYRCPICGQWWRYDPPTEFWDPINTLGMFFSHHSSVEAGTPTQKGKSWPEPIDLTNRH